MKIDGGGSFDMLRDYSNHSAIFSDRNRKFTAADFEALPCLRKEGYQPINWFGQRGYNSKKNNIQEFTDTYLNEAAKKVPPAFILERNTTLLMLCLLPDKLIEEFVNSYTPVFMQNDGKLLKDTLIARKKELLSEIKKIKGFADFVLSDEAKNAVIQLLNHLQTFKPFGKYQIGNSALIMNIKQNFATLKNEYDTIKLKASNNNSTMFSIPVKRILEPETSLEHRNYKQFKL